MHNRRRNNMKKDRRGLLKRMASSIKSYIRDNKNKNTKSGTTFIEVLVTMAIIAILMTTIAVAVIVYIPQANIAKAKNDISVLGMAMTTYYLSHTEFPDTGSWQQDIKSYIDSPKVPKDPWGEEYIYTVPGPEDTPYEIRSKGPNKTQGDEDDIVSGEMNEDQEEDAPNVNK